MKDAKHNIDDLFRRSFEGYTVEPSSSVWNNIIHKYFNTGLSTSGLLSIQNIVSIILIVGAGVMVHYGFNPAEQDNDPINTQVQENLKVTTAVLNKQTTEKTHITTTRNYTQATIESTNSNTQTSSNERPQQIIPQDNDPDKNPESPTHESQVLTSNSTILIETAESYGLSANHTVPGQANQAIDFASLMDTPLTLSSNKYASYATMISLLAEKRINPQVSSFGSTPQSGENLMGAKYNNLLKISKRERDYFRKAHISYRNKYSQVPIQWNNDYLFRSPWALGILFGYEWIYYPGDSVKKKNGYSIDLTAIYQKDHFLLRSGIGVSVSNDNGEFVIDYQTNDSTGFYYGVYSFHIDPDDPENPIFDTYHETVYDSVEHTSYEHPENQYTYIQIPLLIGYKVLEINRFSCAIMGGPLLSILVQEDENTIGFSDVDASLINIEDNTPQRLKTNWQFMISAGLNYKISNHLNLSLEPTYKYYIQSVYEQHTAGTKNPWSIGLRGGIVYTF